MLTTKKNSFTIFKKKKFRRTNARRFVEKACKMWRPIRALDWNIFEPFVQSNKNIHELALHFRQG